MQHRLRHQQHVKHTQTQQSGKGVTQQHNLRDKSQPRSNLKGHDVMDRANVGNRGSIKRRSGEGGGRIHSGRR